MGKGLKAFYDPKNGKTDSKTLFTVGFSFINNFLSTVLWQLWQDSKSTNSQDKTARTRHPGQESQQDSREVKPGTGRAEQVSSY